MTWSSTSRSLWSSFVIISTILMATQCQFSNNAFDNNFGMSDLDIGSFAQATCKNIEADLSTCHDCYLCDSTEYTSKKSRRGDRENTTLEMVNDSCQTTKFCCLSQLDYDTRDNDKCGKYNPEGYPRSVRDELWSVLPGEYPWRAWIYLSTDLSKPLCSATYIREYTRALITSASCIKDYINERLLLRFSRKGQFIEIQNKIPHEEFRSNGRHNDIALINWNETGNQQAPKWIAPCCIEANLPQFGMNCLAVSDNDIYVTQPIPLQKHCTAQITSPNHMCAMAPSSHYIPENSSALMCESQGSYVAYGIALYSEKGVTVYTNVTQYIGWIDSKLNVILGDKSKRI